MAANALPTDPPSPTLDDQVAIVANIRALMGRHQISQERLAEVIGVTRPALSARLKGKTDISVRELGMIARYFGKDIADLVMERYTDSPVQGRFFDETGTVEAALTSRHLVSVVGTALTDA